MKIEYFNPQELFVKEGPVQDSIELPHYLVCLISVALYGFKYAILVDERNFVVDGNYRVYCALELGINVPGVRLKKKKGILWILDILYGQLRLLCGKFWYRKIPVPTFVWDEVPLSVPFQIDILTDEECLYRCKECKTVMKRHALHRIIGQGYYCEDCYNYHVLFWDSRNNKPRYRQFRQDRDQIKL